MYQVQLLCRYFVPSKINEASLLHLVTCADSLCSLSGSGIVYRKGSSRSWERWGKLYAGERSLPPTDGRHRRATGPWFQAAKNWHQQGHQGIAPKIPPQEREQARRRYLRDHAYLINPRNLGLTGARTQPIQDAAEVLIGLKQEKTGPAPRRPQVPPGQPPPFAGNRPGTGGCTNANPPGCSRTRSGVGVSRSFAGAGSGSAPETEARNGRCKKQGRTTSSHQQVETRCG